MWYLTLRFFFILGCEYKFLSIFSLHDLALGVCSLDFVFEVMLWVVDGTERGAICCEPKIEPTFVLNS